MQPYHVKPLSTNSEIHTHLATQYFKKYTKRDAKRLIANPFTLRWNFRVPLFMIVVLMIVGIGCGRESIPSLVESPPVDLNSLEFTPPQVTDITPETNAEAVTLDATIEVSFSKPMNSISVEQCFHVVGNEKYYQGTYEWADEYSFTFTPSTSFELEQIYSIALTTCAVDIYDTALENEYKSSFSTISVDAPGTPILSAFNNPANYSDLLQPLFNWNDIDTEDAGFTYEFQITSSDDADFDDPFFIKTGIPENQVQLDRDEDDIFMENGQQGYYWRVRAVNSYGVPGPFSESQLFVTNFGNIFTDNTEYHNYYPDIVFDGAGYGVSFSPYQQNTASQSRYEVQFERIDRDGSAIYLDEPVIITEDSDQHNYEISIAYGGGIYAMVWHRYDASDGYYHSFLHMVAGNGETVAGPIDINPEVYTYQTSISYNGSVFGVFTRENDGGWKLKFNTFNTSGERVVEDLTIANDINSYTESISQNGNFTCLYRISSGGYDLNFVTLNEQGEIIVMPKRITNNKFVEDMLSLCYLENRNMFGIAYRQRVNDVWARYTISLLITDALGNPLYGPIPVTENDEDDEHGPSIAASRDQFLIAYYKNNRGYYAIHSYTGKQLVPETRITPVESNQYYPKVASSGDEEFGVVWYDNSQGMYRLQYLPLFGVVE